MIKTILQWIAGLIIVVPLAVIITPLVYLMLLSLVVILPPVLVLIIIFEDGEDYKVRSINDGLYKVFLATTLLPLGLLVFAAPLRSVVVVAFSMYPPALIKFNEFHQPFYDYMVPYFGGLFPYWLDLTWGIYGVCVIFAAGIMDSIRRNMLVSQIKNLPTSKIHSAAIGLVELKGKAISARGKKSDPIIRSWIHESGDGMHSIQTETNPFYLDDGTGRVLVDPEGCTVDAVKYLFEIKMHHAVLKTYQPEKKFAESRLMPGEETYVLGSLQINRDKKGIVDQKDKVIIKPQKSSIVRPNFYDLFFVSNKSEEELLTAFKNVIKRGWLEVFILMVLTGWMSILAWSNITQLKSMDLNAAPALFRMLSTPTTLERELSVADLGTYPVIYWLEALGLGNEDAHSIMTALDDQGLGKLAVPTLLDQVLEIDHPMFGVANNWLQELDATPDDYWGHEYWGRDFEEANETVVLRVLLHYDNPALYASYRAKFSGGYANVYEVNRRVVVFEFTNNETGIVKTHEIFSQDGLNVRDEVQVFEYFLPGEYSFRLYPRREYRGGASDHGSRSLKTLEIKF